MTAIEHIPLGYAINSLNGPLSTFKEVIKRRLRASGRTLEVDLQSHHIQVYKNDDLCKPHKLRLDNWPIPFPRCNSSLRLSSPLSP